MKKMAKSTLLFSLFLLIMNMGCGKDETPDTYTPKTDLEIKKEILMNKIWHLSNKLCPDQAFHLQFDTDSVTQTYYQTFDYVTWYDSQFRGGYTLTDDSIKFRQVFYLFGNDILPYRLNEDSLIIYPTSESIINDTHIWVSKPINGKP